MEIELTGRQRLAAALRTARYVNILPVSAVVLEPLPFVAQQHAGLLSGAAHLVQVDGARSHPEARRPARVPCEDSLARSAKRAMQKQKRAQTFGPWSHRKRYSVVGLSSPASTTVPVAQLSTHHLSVGAGPAVVAHRAPLAAVEDFQPSLVAPGAARQSHGTVWWREKTDTVSGRVSRNCKT